MNEEDPDFLLGHRYLDANRWDLAERHLRAGLGRHPLSAADHGYLAVALIRQGQARAGRAEIDEAMRLEPRSPRVLRARVDVLAECGDHGGAVAAARELVTQEPWSSSARAALAFVLLRHRRPRSALKTADEALAIDPADVGALNTRALALSALNRPDEAEPALRDALRQRPESSALHSNMGLLQLRQGQLDAARGSILESLRIGPSTATATNLRRARNPLIAAVAVFGGTLVRGLRTWVELPAGIQVGTIVGLMAGGLAWIGAPSAGLIVLFWSASGWLRRVAPDLIDRIGRSLERFPLMMWSLPMLGLYYVLRLDALGGMDVGIGALLGFLLPVGLGIAIRPAVQDRLMLLSATVSRDGELSESSGRRAQRLGAGLSLASGCLGVAGTLLPWLTLTAPGFPTQTFIGTSGFVGLVVILLATVVATAGLARYRSSGPAGWRRGLGILSGFGIVAVSAPYVTAILEGAAWIAPGYAATLGIGLPIVTAAGTLAIVGGLLGPMGPVVRAGQTPVRARSAQAD